MEIVVRERRTGSRRGLRTRPWWLLLVVAVVASGVGGALVALPTSASAEAPARIFTYEVRGIGNQSDLEDFAGLAGETLAARAGWELGGSISFRRVAGGGDFTLWLAAAFNVPMFGAPCDSTYSCSVGRHVIVNETRWLQGSPSWNGAGGSLRDYRHMVVNHEVGHWLGFGHAGCAGPGQPAPVMQQQSIDLQGCRPNPWPLPGELQALAARQGVAILPSPYGALDTAAVGLDSITVSGWTFDPDTTSPIDVHVYVDGIGIGGFRADRDRPDIGAAFPAAGREHGFVATVGATSGVHTITVYAINVAEGTNTVLGSRSVEVDANPIGSVDLATGEDGQVRVAGWAIDPDVSGPVGIHLYVDGALASATVAAGSRPDIAASFPAFGPSHGFDVTIAGAPGTHTIDVYAINAGPGTVNPRLGRRTVVVHGAPLGNLDRVTAEVGQIRVAGWALDPDTAAPIAVHVYVDGAKAAEVTAAATRLDVGAAFPGAGAGHGFEVAVPVTAGGAHVVHVYAVNAGPVPLNPLIGTARVTTGGNPFGSVDVVAPGAGQIRVAGWALDPDTAAPIAVHVYVDGVKVSAPTAALRRDDVLAAYPRAGADHGFDVLVAASPGSHTVQVYAINVSLGDANPLLATRQITVAVPPAAPPVGARPTTTRRPG